MRVREDRWAVLGSILCRKWHGWLTQFGMATAHDERTRWPLHKVWPGCQCRQVTHNDMPARHITGGDFGGGHGAEVYGGGRLVLSETPNVDTMTGVWS